MITIKETKMTKEENDIETEVKVTTAAESPGFNPKFVALLEHIGRMIAKSMIEESKRKFTPEDKSSEKSDQ
jgi:hypothetical protein